MSSRNAAGVVRAALAEVAKALGHEHRIEIVEQLAQGPRSVDALATRVGLSVANASQHLQQLRRAGLVNSQRDGKRVVYRLADDAETDIVALLGGLRRVAEHTVAAMERVIGSYFRARDELEPVPASELVTRLREGSVVLLDVRPRGRIWPRPSAGRVEHPACASSRRALANCRAIMRSSPIAADPTAFCRSRPWRPCARMVSTCVGSKTVFRNGRPPGLPIEAAA